MIFKGCISSKLTEFFLYFSRWILNSEVKVQFFYTFPQHILKLWKTHLVTSLNLGALQFIFIFTFQSSDIGEGTITPFYGDEREYRLVNLEIGVKYLTRVRAIDFGQQEGEWASPISFTLGRNTSFRSWRMFRMGVKLYRFVIHQFANLNRNSLPLKILLYILDPPFWKTNAL